jgi:anti-sigma-K factor RskA
MRLSHDAADALAAEYVLGTLRGPARTRFAKIASRDPVAAEAMRRWETAFAPLAGRVPGVEPAEKVWRTIESRIAAPRTMSTSPFWRPFALITGGMASVLLAFFLYVSIVPPSEPMFVSVLTSPDNTPRLMVSMYKPDIVRVKMMKPWKDMPGKGLELWVIPAEGHPRSLGMVSNDAPETMIHVAENDPRVQGAKALAVSMEPMGGSPTGQPTGPVLCSGLIAMVKRA